MKSSISIFCVTLLIGLAAAFVNFQYDKEHEFKFTSEFNVYPSTLGGGQQLINATLLVRKVRSKGRSLVVRVKDSSLAGANINSQSKSYIEGIFGINRNPVDEIKSIVSKSTEVKEVLTKKFIASMLINNLSFINKYLASSEENRKNKHRVPLSIGWCRSDITAMHNTKIRLTVLSAQAAITECEINPFILLASHLLLYGTNDQIEDVKKDSHFELNVAFDSTTRRILQVSRSTFLNLVVAGRDVQTIHNVKLDYVGEHYVSNETKLVKPHHLFSNDDMDNFFRTK